MKEVKTITNDKVAFYIGVALMCKKCEINKEKIKIIKKYYDYITFYEINANNIKEIINKYQIKYAPFFIITTNGQIKEIFYEINDLNLLNKKLLSYKGEENEKTNTFIQT